MKKICHGLWVMVFFIGSGFFIQGCINQVTIIEYEELTALIDSECLIEEPALRTFAIIDIRTREAWEAGHLQDAQNIPHDEFLSGPGLLVNNGDALTSVVPDKAYKIIIYGSGDGKAGTFAQKASQLGYQNVYWYRGGVPDWESNGDYFVIEYGAFKPWHEAECPFTDGENYLVDTMPFVVYAGLNTGSLSGHIPGAINVPVETLVGYPNDPFALVNDGKALSDAIPNKNAKIIMYCYYWHCPISYYTAKVAMSLGYKHIYKYQGAMQEWVEEGNELLKISEPGPCEE